MTQLAALEADGEVDYSVTGSMSRHIELKRLPRPIALDHEGTRWAALRETLRRRVSEGDLTRQQVEACRYIWTRAIAYTPHLRYPAVGVSADGALEVAWSFADVPAHVATVSISRDGAFEWFTRDANSGAVNGAEQVRSINADLLSFLAENFPRRRPLTKP